MSTPTRAMILAELSENFGLSGRVADLVSSLAYEVSAADLLDWAVRNEFISDPDANEDGDYEDEDGEQRSCDECDCGFTPLDDERICDDCRTCIECKEVVRLHSDLVEGTCSDCRKTELEFEVGDWIEVQQGSGEWVAAEVLTTDADDPEMPYRCRWDAPTVVDCWAWFAADRVRREGSGE